MAARVCCRRRELECWLLRRRFKWTELAEFVWDLHLYEFFRFALLHCLSSASRDFVVWKEGPFSPSDSSAVESSYLIIDSESSFD